MDNFFAPLEKFFAPLEKFFAPLDKLFVPIKLLQRTKIFVRLSQVEKARKNEKMDLLVTIPY